MLKNHGARWELAKGEKLTPVLAVGSNAAPTQLARKFPPDLFPDGVVIPVLRCVLPDFDVVYAPLISSYGSCTGGLVNTKNLCRNPPCTDTTVLLHVLLDPLCILLCCCAHTLHCMVLMPQQLRLSSLYCCADDAAAAAAHNIAPDISVHLPQDRVASPFPIIHMSTGACRC